MRRSILRAALLGLLIAAFSQPSNAKSMLIGGLAVAPYTSDTWDGSDGILIDLLRRTMARYNVIIEFHSSSWLRAVSDVKDGYIDAVMPAIYSKDREEYLIYPDEPLIEMEMTLFRSIDSMFKFSGNMTDLSGLSVGRIQSGRVAPSFDEAADYGVFQLEERHSFDLLVRGLASGRIDLIAGDRLMIVSAATQAGVIDRIAIVRPQISRVPVYIGISKESRFADPIWISRISEALSLEKSTPAHRRAVDRYVSGASPLKP